MSVTKLNSPILLTGCPRSGTSLIAQVFAKCSCFTGSISKHNMFENTFIKEEIIKPYLSSIKADVNGVYPLPKQINIPVNWKESVEASILEQGYRSGNWMVKDAKSSLLWQIWNHAYPNAKWVIVRRKPKDIINSCLKTGYMKSFSDPDVLYKIKVDTEEEGWKWMINEYEKRFVEMISAGLNVKVIWPERMVHGDYQQLYETLEWLGLPWKSNILNFIDPLLWNSRKKERSL